MLTFKAKGQIQKYDGGTVKHQNGLLVKVEEGVTFV